VTDRSALLYLRREFREAWTGQDPFEMVQRLTGRIYRDLNGRRTLRFELNGRGYFLKLHTGVGWSEIVKNLLQFKMPILGAENEWQAIERLHQVGVDTMTLAAYGSRGTHPAHRVSFVITDELEGMLSLEDLCSEWIRIAPPFVLKKFLVERVAAMSRTMHDNGMNHRDFYICHFLTDLRPGSIPAGGERLVLIDLHRVQIREKTPKRWVCKDLGGLGYSVMDIGLKKTDLFRFMKQYSGKSLRRVLAEDSAFWREVRQRTIALYRKVNGRGPSLLA